MRVYLENRVHLFLDDLRDPPNDGRRWAVARSCAEARKMVMNSGSSPFLVSFDHDLGDDGEPEETGYTFAKWLVEQDLDRPGFLHSGFSYRVHSANPIGAENIRRLLDNYLSVRSG
jgi:hypothetical protein